MALSDDTRSWCGESNKAQSRIGTAPGQADELRSGVCSAKEKRPPQPEAKAGANVRRTNGMRSGGLFPTTAC
jgi:hypothetical protein